MDSTIFFKYLLFGKIAVLFALSKKYDHKFNQKFWVSALLFSLFVMMVHFFMAFLGLRFSHPINSADLKFKFAVNFFPALIYFWILARFKGYMYWVIWGIGVIYFIMIMKITLTT